MDLNEIHDGLFQNEEHSVMISDDYWKLPQHILNRFEKLDKSIHKIVLQKPVIMKCEGWPDHEGILMTNAVGQTAYYKTEFIEFVNEHNPIGFYLTERNGLLLVECDDEPFIWDDEQFIVIAPYVPEEAV